MTTKPLTKAKATKALNTIAKHFKLRTGQEAFETGDGFVLCEEWDGTNWAIAGEGGDVPYEWVHDAWPLLNGKLPGVYAEPYDNCTLVLYRDGEN